MVKQTMSFEQALSWTRYEQRKQQLLSDIRCGKVKASEYERQIAKIAKECGV